MQSLNRFVITFFTCIGFALVANAGPEPMSSKETKEVIQPQVPSCDWSGIYIGLHIGGQFGHSENVDHDYNVGPIPGSLASSAARSEDAPTGPRSTGFDRPWGYSESGVVAGGQVGYNLQFGHIVFGPEFDLGYMNLDGSGTEPGSPGGDTRGESGSDFYMTFRGRVGFALDCWLFYVTGGGIAVNYDTRVVDDCTDGDCGGGLIDAHKQEFNWGPTLGGGIERKIGRHWSVKVEYLYYDIDDQSFSGDAHFIKSNSTPNVPNVPNGPVIHHQFSGDSEGHIVRAGLNFHF